MTKKRRRISRSATPFDVQAVAGGKREAKIKSSAPPAVSRKAARMFGTANYTVVHNPRPWLMAMMASPMIPLKRSRREPLLESGVLAYRRRKNRGPEVLIISKKSSKRSWGIPKGRVEPHLSFGENAATEAFQEAGVVGYTSPGSVGMFRSKKRTADPDVLLVMEVWVYLLEVTHILSDWPERRSRETKWVSCKAAARQLREPMLAHLCQQLAQQL